jgi:3-hydroxybutyryl-CoA dehydrogenase
VNSVKQITVVGAGLMGHGIAQVFARKGFPVFLYDLREDLLKQALMRIRANLDILVESGFESPSRIEGILSRIALTTDLGEALKGADFVLEAVPEDFELKKSLFEEMDRLTPDHTIIASNTSMLSISQFGKGVGKKENLIIAHWFNPPHIVPVVELVMGERTSEDTFRVTFDLLTEVGKEPVKVLKETPGFLVNRIQTAMFREVLSLLEQGIASPEDLDRAVKGSFGLRLGVMGVLETMDMAGLDLMYKGIQHLYPSIDRSTTPQKIMEEKIGKGELGLKTGKGFFAYEPPNSPNGSAQRAMTRDRNLLKILKALGS